MKIPRNRVEWNASGMTITQKSVRYECLLDKEDIAPVKAQYRSFFVAVYSGKPYVRDSHTGAPLHRILLGLKQGDLPVDHKNGNTLDCRRGNLRAVTQRINMINRRGAHSGSLSGIRGLYKQGGKWLAKGAGEYLGFFSDPRDAAEAVWLKLLQVDQVSAENYLRGLPLECPEEFLPSVSINIPSALWEKAAEVAIDRNVPCSKFFAEAIRQHLESNHA